MRGLVAAALIGSVYSVIVMKLNLTTGFVPTMNVSAALLAFLALRGWTGALARLGAGAGRPFTRQENTVVQTCAVACYSLALCGTCQNLPAGRLPALAWPVARVVTRVSWLACAQGSGRPCWA